MRVRLNNNLSSGTFTTRFFVLLVFIFSLEYATYLVTSSLLDYIIKLSSFAFLMLFVVNPRNHINKTEGGLLLIYCMLFTSALFPLILNESFSGVIISAKLFLMSLILPILILCYRALQRCDDFLISVYIVIGVLFSVQAIVAFIGVYWGVFDKSNIIEIERYSNMGEVSFGIWGFGNAIQSPIEGYKILRPQGWFLEPSILASFLLLPAYVSAGRYWVYRKKKYIFASLTIFLTIFLTLSLAGYLGVVVAALLLLFAKPFYNRLKRFQLLRYFYPIPIFFLFFGFAFSLLHIGHLANEVDVSNASEGQALVAQLYERNPDGPSGNLIREVYKLDNYVNLIATTPLGAGFGAVYSSEFRSGNALLFWLVAGGIPAVIIIIIMFFYIFSVFCHPLLMSENAVYRALAASFVGHAIHNLSYGTWIAPYFLIHLALLVMSTRKVTMEDKE